MRFSKILNIFKIVSNGQVLNLPKVQFQQEKFNDFLSTKYGVSKTPNVLFASSFLRWMLGLFQYRKNRIMLFWPGIITKSFSENSNPSQLFASVLAHETSHFLETRGLKGRVWLGVQYGFSYAFVFFAGLHCVSSHFLFFPLNIFVWLFSFCIYFLLPSETKARKFAKTEMAANKEQWQTFFEIS